MHMANLPHPNSYPSSLISPSQILGNKLYIYTCIRHKVSGSNLIANVKARSFIYIFGASINVIDNCFTPGCRLLWTLACEEPTCIS